MKKSIFKSVFLIGFAVIFSMTLLLSGCGANSNTNDNATSGTVTDNSAATTASAAETNGKLDPVTLKIFMPGDRPADFDKVISTAQEEMADTINVQLNVTFIPWADLSQKTSLILNSGEDCDLMFDAPWNGMQNKIDNGSYYQLDDLLQKYGPDIIKTTGQAMIDANKFKGKIMGIPLGSAQAIGATFHVRKDIREKLGIAPIKTYDDLVKFLYAVKDKEKGMIPYLPAGVQGAQDWSAVGALAYFDYNEHIRYTDIISRSLVLYYKNNDGKVYNLFDEMDPQIWGWIKDARKLYQDGIIYKDVLTVKDHTITAQEGKVAAYPRADFGVQNTVNSALKAIDPSYEIEAVTFYKPEKGANISNFAQWNFMCIPNVSKNKERAMMFLNWPRLSQDNYDLLAYGIKDVNYSVPKEGEYTPIGTNYTWFPYDWIWNPAQDRVDSSFDDYTKSLINFTKQAENYTPDKLIGFTFNPKNVQNELAQYNTIDAKYYCPICDGVVDPDTGWAQFKQEAAPLVKKIQDEAQKQIDEFLANK